MGVEDEFPNPKTVDNLNVAGISKESKGPGKPTFEDTQFGWPFADVSVDIFAGWDIFYFWTGPYT